MRRTVIDVGKCTNYPRDQKLKARKMPSKCAHFCNHPGCNELTTHRYCDKHTQEHEAEQKKANARYDKERGSSTSRGYDELWRKVRLSYLKAHPLCELCDKEGKITPAVLVHHIKPIDEGGDRLRRENLQALCNDHHEGIHGKDRFKRRY